MEKGRVSFLTEEVRRGFGTSGREVRRLSFGEFISLGGEQGEES